MAEPAFTPNLDNAFMRTYDVKIGGTDVGWCDEPEVTQELSLQERKQTKVYGQVLGHRLVGVKVTVKVTLRELTKANHGLAVPWYTANDIALMPTTLGGDLYQYAKEVLLHPRDKADTTEDIKLLKAVPIGPLTIKGDGANEGGIPLTLFAYPDRSQLPNLVLGSIGVTAG